MRPQHPWSVHTNCAARAARMLFVHDPTEGLWWCVRSVGVISVPQGVLGGVYGCGWVDFG
jgi:hypothetical protein